jgi:hypothetical protein
VPGDHGAHGIFDNRVHASSVQFWQTTRRASWIPTVLGIAALGCGLFLRSKQCS